MSKFIEKSSCLGDKGKANHNISGKERRFYVEDWNGGMLEANIGRYDLLHPFVKILPYPVSPQKMSRLLSNIFPDFQKIWSQLKTRYTTRVL